MNTEIEPIWPKIKQAIYNRIPHLQKQIIKIKIEKQIIQNIIQIKKIEIKSKRTR